jgi:hypothetical protein
MAAAPLIPPPAHAAGSSRRWRFRDSHCGSLHAPYASACTISCAITSARTIAGPSVVAVECELALEREGCEIATPRCELTP